MGVGGNSYKAITTTKEVRANLEVNEGEIRDKVGQNYGDRLEEPFVEFANRKPN